MKKRPAAMKKRPAAVKKRPAAMKKRPAAMKKRPAAKFAVRKVYVRDQTSEAINKIIFELATRGLAAQDGTVARIDSFADGLQMRLAQQEWIKRNHEARLKRVEEHLDMVGP